MQNDAANPEGKCVPAIVNAAWATWVLASLPSGSNTISSKMGKLNIVSLPLVPKMFTVFFIQLPLVFLDVALAIVGMKFLMYCNALGKLIVKAMSLSYIETVAGVVFVTLTHMNCPVVGFSCLWLYQSELG